MKVEIKIMNNELISIIIPVYNVEKYLKRCLDSVVNQTYNNLEIICINDGSKDNSENILKEYKNKDNRIVIINKQNEGVSSARNEGINYSHGNYVCFVDSDDWLEHNAIETLYTTLLEQDVDVVRGNYYRNFDDEFNEIHKMITNYKNKNINLKENKILTEIFEQLVNGKIQCYVWLLLIKREIIKGKLFFEKDICFMEDNIFYIQLIQKINTIYFLDIPIYHYFCNNSSCMKSMELYIRNMYNILKVNKYVINILENAKSNSLDIVSKVNTIHLTFILDYIFKIYKMKIMDRGKIILELEKLNNLDEFKSIYKNINIANIAIYKRVLLNFIVNKKYKTLFIFCKIRTVASNLKSCITKKKEV